MAVANKNACFKCISLWKLIYFKTAIKQNTKCLWIKTENSLPSNLQWSSQIGLIQTVICALQIWSDTAIFPIYTIYRKSLLIWHLLHFRPITPIAVIKNKLHPSGTKLPIWASGYKSPVIAANRPIVVANKQQVSEKIKHWTIKAAECQKGLGNGSPVSESKKGNKDAGAVLTVELTAGHYS